MPNQHPGNLVCTSSLSGQFLCYIANDVDPNYDRILYLEEVPTWPSSLRIIDLQNLRNWTVETAEMFFMSLVDSSAQLRHLRQLSIKAILTTGWKVRAEFRTKWIDMLEKVFLSRRPDPNPTWTSIEAYNAQKILDAGSKAEQIADADVDDADVDDDDGDDIVIRRPRLRNKELEDQDASEPGLPSRRLTRLRLGEPVKPSRKPAGLKDSVPLLGRGQRTTRSRITYAEPETSDGSEDELGAPTQSDNEDDQLSDHVAINMSRMSKELANMNAIARQYPQRRRRRPGPLYRFGNPPASDSDSDDKPVLRKRTGKGKPASDLDSDDEPLWAKKGKGKPILDIDSDDEPLWGKKGKGKAVQAVHEPFVQGMCDLVKICCDNMRPREQLFSEGDFLNIHDDSDDSEWDGEDRIPGDDEIAF